MPPNPNNKQQPGGRQAALINAEKPKNARETLGKLLRYIGRSKYLFFGLMAIMLMITLLGLAAPYIQQIAIDCITLDDKKLSVDTERLVKILIILGVVYLMNSVFSYLQGIFSARLSQKTVSTMRRDLFGDLVKLPIKYFDSHRHGDIMSRMTNDVENISNTVSQSIGSLISGVLTVVGSIVIMLTYSPLLTLISLSTVVLTVFVSTKMTKYMRRYFLKQQIILGKLNGHVEEMVTGHRTVVSYSKEQAAVEDFNVMSDVIDFKESKAYKSGEITEFKLEETIPHLEINKEPAIKGPLLTGGAIADALVLQYYEEIDDRKAAFGHTLSTEDWKTIAEIKDVYGNVLFTAPSICYNVAHPLLAEIQKELTNKDRKFTFLCGHDSNLSSVLASLQVEDYTLPSAIESKTPIGGKLVINEYKGKDDKEYYRIDLVYQSVNQLRNISMLSLENPPMIKPLRFKGLTQNEKGLYEKEAFLERLSESVNEYDRLVEKYS